MVELGRTIVWMLAASVLGASLLVGGCALPPPPTDLTKTPEGNSNYPAHLHDAPAGIPQQVRRPNQPEQRARPVPSPRAGVNARKPQVADSGQLDLADAIADLQRQGRLNPKDAAGLKAQLRDVPPQDRALVIRSFLAMKQLLDKPSSATTSPSDTSHRPRPGAAQPTKADKPGNPLRQTNTNQSQLAASILAARLGQNSLLNPAGGDKQSLTKALLAQAQQPVETPPRTPPPQTPPPMVNPPIRRAKLPPITSDEDGKQWKAVLAAAIRALSDQLTSLDESEWTPEQLQLHARLRLLYLAAGQRDAAMQLPAGATDEATSQKFWAETMLALHTYLDREKIKSDSRRGALAAGSLRKAVLELGETSMLQVRNLAFCRRVVSFGAYDAFATPEGKYQFEPNQEVLVYAELQNFTSSGDPSKGYTTTLRASYEILDAAGRRVGNVHNLGDSKDVCKNRRTDFFVRYFINLPTRLNPGEYRLRLTIEDTTGNKAGEAEETFTIGEES